MNSIKRAEMDGEFQYKAILTKDGKKLSETVYSDWFANDAAAVAGYGEIAQELGYEVVAVKIGEITEVVVK